MDESIQLIETVRQRVREKARTAFIMNAGRDSHNMNPGSLAHADWLAEYDRLDAHHRALHAVCVAKGQITAHAGQP